MERMRLTMEYCLRVSKDPLSFIVIVPHWTDSETIQLLDASLWLRAKLLLSPKSHSYVSGLQHRANSYRRKYIAIHETSFYFLQNDPGFALWPPGSSQLELLKKSMI